MGESRAAAPVGWGLLGLGVSLGLALVIGASRGADALLEARRQGQTLEVKGFAEKRIVSDHALWRASVVTRGAALQETYARLEESRDALLAFLAGEAVPDAELQLHPVSTRALFARDERGHLTHEVEGYELSQQISVSSGDIARVARVARRASDLVRQGIELSAGSPEYLYTDLESLKIEMLAEATADARRRAEVLARGSGSALGALRWARQGVFQITPPHSTEVSNYGRNDTSSREKAIKAVVTVRYAIDPASDATAPRAGDPASDATAP
jgi:hypothetical protein